MNMPKPWAIEARITPFHPWQRLCLVDRLEDACRRARDLKRLWRYSSTRVRAV